LETGYHEIYQEYSAVNSRLTAKSCSLLMARRSTIYYTIKLSISFL